MLPGYFYCGPLDSVIENEMVCHFGMVRGVRKDDFLALNKVVELRRVMHCARYTTPDPRPPTHTGDRRCMERETGFEPATFSLGS